MPSAERKWIASKRASEAVTANATRDMYAWRSTGGTACWLATGPRNGMVHVGARRGIRGHVRPGVRAMGRTARGGAPPRTGDPHAEGGGHALSVSKGFSEHVEGPALSLSKGACTSLARKTPPPGAVAYGDVVGWGNPRDMRASVRCPCHSTAGDERCADDARGSDAPGRRQSGPTDSAFLKPALVGGPLPHPGKITNSPAGRARHRFSQIKRPFRMSSWVMVVRSQLTKNASISPGRLGSRRGTHRHPPVRRRRIVTT